MSQELINRLKYLSKDKRIALIRQCGYKCSCVYFTGSLEQALREVNSGNSTNSRPVDSVVKDRDRGGVGRKKRACKHIIAVLRYLGESIQAPAFIKMKSLADPSQGKVESHATHGLGHDRLIGKEHAMGNFNGYDGDGLPSGLRARQERELSALFKKDVRLKPLKRNG